MKLIVVTIMSFGFFGACSDESQVEEQKSQVKTEETKKDSAEKSTCDKSTTKLALVADENTYHSAAVQGLVVGFCGGCHGGEMPDGGVDFTDYDRMLASFSAKNQGPSRIIEKVVNGNHQSLPQGDKDIISAWGANNFSRGTPPGGSDDSPFFDESGGDNGIDLEDFDPFADPEEC